MPDVNEIIDRLLDQMFGAPLPTGDPGRRFGVVHFEDAEAAVLAAFAAGRAAATPDPPDDDDICAVIHEGDDAASPVVHCLRVGDSVTIQCTSAASYHIRLDDFGLPETT